jgi:hypothetical protein
MAKEASTLGKEELNKSLAPNHSISSSENCYKPGFGITSYTNLRSRLTAIALHSVLPAFGESCGAIALLT